MRDSFFTITLKGVKANIIKVDINAIPGNFSLSILGIPSWLEKNCRKRIISAFHFNNIPLPSDKSFIINISANSFTPNDSSFDLVVALSLLRYLNEIPEENMSFLSNSVFLGEISLTGEIRPVRGCISAALAFKRSRKNNLIIPASNEKECSVLHGNNIFSIEHIKQLIKPLRLSPIKYVPPILVQKEEKYDISQIHGHFQAKKALEISASGRHHILFFGPPGSGKTMLSQRLISLLPPFNQEELLECTEIYSTSDMLKENHIINERPFRFPHHSSSEVGIIGGGNYPFPGEITLAHNGVLFLDELLEFKKSTLETLRQVLEDRCIHIKKSNYAITFPAQFVFVAALNPCPCGYFNSFQKQCTCSFFQIKSYLSRISGPFIDRIDMQLSIEKINMEKKEDLKQEPIQDIKKRIENAEKIQQTRNPRKQNNGLLEGFEIEKVASLSSEASDFLHNAFQKMNISMRSFHKILRVARTIADLKEQKNIEREHIKEALLYRSFDKLMEKLYE